jgi:1-deoxy-D-xylulose-5-phosphate synthase
MTEAHEAPEGEAPTPLLDSIESPADLSGRSDEELARIAQEVRELIIDTIGEIGGHFGANLGTCELTTVLHSLLDSPSDKILWDVGHQAYPHKVLTGRRDRLHTIRQYKGLAPFCSIFESDHDIMGAGHASTSIASLSPTASRSRRSTTLAASRRRS